MIEKLRYLRLTNKKTHKDMAKLLGLKTASAYCKKEAGLIPFSLIEAQTIAVYFESTIEDIFFENELS